MWWTALYAALTAVTLGVAYRSDSRVAIKLALMMFVNFGTTIAGVCAPAFFPVLAQWGDAFIVCADGINGLFVYYGIAAFYRSRAARGVGAVFLLVEAWHMWAAAANIQHAWGSYAVLNVLFVAQLALIIREAVRYGANRRAVDVGVLSGRAVSGG